MNADEIVKNLRAEAQFQKDRFSRFLLADAMSNAADLIESLQTQLSASQRREKAAVEDIHEIDRFNGKCLRCKSWNGVRCKRGYSVNASFCNDWAWRGPEAVEGVTVDG